MIAQCFIEKKRRLGVTACYSHRNKVAILAAFIVFAGGGAAFGQVCNFPAPVCPNAATCPAGCTLDDTTTPACDTSLEHGQGATAACQNRCVGETLSCTGTSAYVDQLQDVIRLEEAFNTVDGTVRSPAAGNLPIVRVFFNAVCTNSGGVCNPATGANCVFPCLVGPGGLVYTDPSTGLTLPGLAGNGQVRVADNQYVIQPGDVGNLGNTFTFVGTDLCTSCCSNCPTTCDSATASSNTVVPNCNDGDPCTTDCCVAGVCSNPSVCIDNSCANGTTPENCNDSNVCTTDSCNNGDNTGGAAGVGPCCSNIPIICPTPPVCFTQGPCHPVTGCPAPVSDCVTNPNLCDDDNACTRDICDESAPGCCRYEVIECPAPPVCFTQGLCNPATGCPPPVSDCVSNPALCDDGNACTEDTCDESAPGCCTHENICQSDAICRTPGFWGTHGGTEKSRSQNITQAVIDACGGALDVCGECISTTAVDDAASALEAICVSPKGQVVLQNARQITALALNCCISGFGADCGGDTYLSGLFNDCNNACQDFASTRTNARCRDEIDCFNNGGQFDPVTGTCGDGGAENCHTRQLVNEDLGLNFQPPGPAGSAGACRAARGNHCAILDLSGCDLKNGQGEDCCDTDSCPELPGPDPDCAGETCFTFTSCNPTSGCTQPVCGTTAEGGGICVEGTTPCAGLLPCITSADCTPGFCMEASCCGTPVCIPVAAFCPEVAGGAAGVPSGPAAVEGPTLGGQ